jgi:hypothetical protein
MLRCTLLVTITFVSFGTARPAAGEDVLFEDNFDGPLSPEWQAVGLKKDDYRLRDNKLELRVQPGKRTRDTPMLMVLLPFSTSESVTASVELTLIDEFTEPDESAGLFLTDADSREFGAEKRNLDGQLVFSPGNDEFIGDKGEEDDPQKYALKFWPVNEDDGPLRIIVRGHYGHFQVGPSRSGKYLNFFHSALRENEPKRGFCLSASGGPSDRDHWVRFDNFRVIRQ